MRAGLLLSGRRNAREAVALAVEAEALGVDEIWVSEDYCERGAFVLAAAVAQATSRARLGLGVVNAWTRHPVLAAMEFAALDEIAEGRAVLGIGASNPYWMEHQLGIPFRQPLTRMREYVDLLRPLLAGKRVDHDGPFWEIHTQLSFSPERTAPPIVLGVKGPRAMDMASDHADGVLLSLLAGPAYVAWARKALNPSADVSAYIAFSCDSDAAAARDRLRPLVAKYIGVHGVHTITEAAGIPNTVARACRQGWQQNAPRNDLIDDAILDAVTVSGNIDDCQGQLRQLGEAGLDAAVLTDELTLEELTLAVQVVHDS
jgi:5,10-methylenetetrahydromethanopterin reductase